MKDTPFTEARLLSLYDRVAEAEDAIPRLRRFVLDLAVRGKLVRQDAGDEPASVLLERIETEKALLVKARAIKKTELPDITKGDEPYKIPRNWSWTRLGTIGDWGAGSTPPRGNPDLFGGGITWLKSGELNDNTELVGSEETVSEYAVTTGSFRLNKPGDVLIAMYGATIGKLAILAENAVTNQAVCGCTPFKGVHNRFLYLFLLSYRANFHAASEGGAQPNISKVKIVNTPLPLPPLAEQHRIVAKVEELMALLDRLEAARAAREEARTRLTAATLSRLTEADSDTPTAARFALQTLPALTTRPDQIKTLRQTILNLAVRGKLVVQDAGDEPASVLVERIGDIRKGRVAAGELKKPKETSPIAPTDCLFSIPTPWAWAMADTLWDFENGDRSANYPSRDQLVETGIPFINAGHLDGGRVSLVGMNFITVEKFKSLAGGKLRQGDQLYCLRGSLGKHAVFDYQTDAAIASSLVILRPVLRACVPYLACFLDSDAAQVQLRRFDNGSAQPNLSSANLRRFIVPLPPLAEQQRIVAKVDELMSLCDRLERALQDATTTRARLLDATLREALAGAQEAA
ncbi:restriction endonuclease subunit S [Fuscovulum ytuae]|uniref:Restriction endonuclease subunit S n=1 Tax=Fuscovulum ytuae TaxID=3042299 RepID=A0ABY8Q6Q8_9RHOB|nr:restriction endonuclease subunit S [Fuscovulum sp. YMD61]WGV16000.1 restriction endonuclease subunit S [Fuscovulum sp. YMD61]